MSVQRKEKQEQDVRHEGLPIQTVHGISYPRVGLNGDLQDEPTTVISDLTAIYNSDSNASYGRISCDSSVRDPSDNE